jgi:signal transduction histidine kinase
MAFSAKESLVLRSSCGLIVIDHDSMETWWRNPKAQVPYRLLDSYDGAHLSHAVFSPQMSLAPDGKLWIANQGGIQVLDPDRLSENSLVPPVHIEEIIADRVRVEPATGLMLPPLTRDLEIHYTGLSLSVPQKVRFRYMLENRDANWQEPGTRRTAFYQDLKPGHYRFRVVAANNDGAWNNTGDMLEFSVKPAWFQTLWFQLLWITVACVLIWAIYALRVRSIARAIMARFDERLDERTRMALELHDTFLQTVQGSKMVADDALDPASDQAHMRVALEKLSLWLGQAVTEGRAALHALRVSTTERNHLALFLDRSAKEHCQRTSISVALTVIGDAVDLHPIVRDEITRIAEEGIRNACLHSKGSQLSIELRYARDLSLSLKDNGVGIDPEVVDTGRPGHFGIQGMRERSARIRARISITSTLNSGTQIALVVPGDVVYRREEKTFLRTLRESNLWRHFSDRASKGKGEDDAESE